MPLSNNTSTTCKPTNETWSDSDLMKLIELLNQVILLVTILISIFIIIGNTLILLATWRERSLHQPNKYFIASLAVADLMVGIFIGPIRVYGLGADSQRDISIQLCRLAVWMDTLVLTASVYTLTFISFSRPIP